MHVKPSSGRVRSSIVLAFALAGYLATVTAGDLRPGDLAADPLPAGGAAPNVGCGTRHVDDTGDDTANDCLTPATPCLTIQHAIDEACAGDTVLVEPGTYNENPVIAKALTLQSALGRDWTTIQLPPVGDGPGYLTPVLIQASNVTVDGFTIVGNDATASASGLANSNIYVDNNASFAGTPMTGIVVKNNRLKVGQIGGATTFDDGIGLITTYNGVVTLDDLTVTDNLFVPLAVEGARAFYINSGVDKFSFKRNTITGRFAFTTSTEAHDGLIENNVLDGQDLGGRGFGCYGNTDATFWGHTVFRGNVVLGALIGIRPADANNVLLECNRSMGNTVGVSVQEFGGTPGFDPTTIELHDNAISNNTTNGAENLATTSGTVDATGNWWGCVAGPGNAGCDTVAGDLDATSPLAEPPPCGSCTADEQCDDDNPCTDTTCEPPTNLVVNGSFEDGTDPGGAFLTLPPGSTDITGWTVGGGGVDYIGGYWESSDGSRNIDLSGNSAGSIAQTTLATTPGTVYRLTFDMAGNPDGAPVVKTIQASLQGATTQSATFAFDTTGKSRPSPMGWEPREFVFTADAATTDLTFESLTGTAFGPALDNVRVSEALPNTCVSVNNTDPCDDDLFCTENDTCSAGACAGAARDCGDGNPCTADSCDEVGDTCVNDPAPANGNVCDDGLFCTVSDACSAGMCAGGPRNCDDGNPCTVDSCDEGLDTCVHDAAAADGSACSDSDACTTNDVCSGGTCGHTVTIWNVPVAGACTTGDPNCLTIQAAITAADTDDVIVVAAGSYPENLVLAKRLTIRGAQVGVSACGRLDSESEVIGADATSNRLDLETCSAGSVIDGLTFSGGTRTIESHTGPIHRIQLLNNRVRDFTGSGIFLNDNGNNITVDGNELDAAAKTGGGDTFHLDQDDFDGFRASNNCIIYTGADPFAVGTGLFCDGNHNLGPSTGGDGRTPLLSGNLITKHATGSNLGRFAFDGGAISNNEFSFNQFDGLQGGIQNTTIDHNSFAWNGRHGLALTGFSGSVSGDSTRGAKNDTVVFNCFTANGLTASGAGISFNPFQFPGTISTNHVHDNSFSGNFRGAIYNAPGTETIDCEDNYWGSPSGPLSPPQNPGGTGDPVDTPNASGGLIDVLTFSDVPAVDCPCGKNADCDDGNECTLDVCDAVLGCVISPEAAGTSCGDGDDTDCTDPDTCDGAGACQANDATNGAFCGDTGTDCTNQDTCSGGVCQDNGIQTPGTACGSPDDTDCTDPDTCDAFGICQSHDAAAGAPCGDGSSGACDAADSCDGAGACDPNTAANGTACDDGLFCTVSDECQAGTCTSGPARDCTGTSGAGVDFEAPTYSLGTIDGQDGWSSTGAAGSGCAVYDHAVATNSYGYGAFGGQSLRMSNAVTSGCFGDQTFSKSLADEVGERASTNNGLSGGTRRTHFEAEWSFASTVPGAEQPGLSVVASPDRGDGARMSWVQMTDTPGGLDVNFFDYQDLAPQGSLGDPDAGCGAEDDFFFTPVATSLDRTVPHTIKITLDTFEGPANDVVKVYVDGVLKHTGTSWEDYFRWCEQSPVGISRTVDSILFRTGGTAAPATLGNGFVIDNLTLASGLEGDQCTAGACNEDTDSCELVPANEGGACDDGLFCTVDDTCSGGTCSGSPKSCDDGNPCTDDSCDEAGDACDSTPNTDPCDDGDACTTGDTCGGGSCQPGGPTNCDDGDDCTVDTCDSQTGCHHEQICCDDPSPHTAGFYQRMCSPIYSGPEPLTQADVDCINDSCTFADVLTIDDLCVVLRTRTDGCTRAEIHFMGLLLNLCRGHVCVGDPIDSSCGDNTTVGQTADEIDALLCNDPSLDECKEAACEGNEVNNGTALILDTLLAAKVPGNKMKLTWSEPLIDADKQIELYEVWRSVDGLNWQLVGQVPAGQPMTFVDSTFGPTSYQYDVTVTLHD